MPAKPNKRRRDSLPKKEFTIMIKMIKNLENKMELQINRLRIEKMQDMFNKNLEK